MRKSNVLSLPLQLVFPGSSHRHGIILAKHPVKADLQARKKILVQLISNFNFCLKQLQCWNGQVAQTSKYYRLLNGAYRLPCLLHQYCKRPQQKKKEKKPITSCASSGHITKLKQSIFLRCLWQVGTNKQSMYSLMSMLGCQSL